MIPSSFNESNVVLNPPNKLKEVCECLNAHIGVCHETEVPIIITCWKVTAEDLEEINKTKRVWMIVAGEHMVPVHLTGINPFIYEDGKDDK